MSSISLGFDFEMHREALPGVHLYLPCSLPSVSPGSWQAVPGRPRGFLGKSSPSWIRTIQKCFTLKGDTISPSSVAVTQPDWDLHIKLEPKRNNNLTRLVQLMSYELSLSVFNCYNGTPKVG